MLPVSSLSTPSSSLEKLKDQLSSSSFCSGGSEGHSGPHLLLPLVDDDDDLEGRRPCPKGKALELRAILAYFESLNKTENKE
jgi:hypothetical protein